MNREIFRIICLAAWVVVPAQAQLLLSSYDSSGNITQRVSGAIAAPQIIGQPQLQIVVPGDTGTFSVVLADSGGCAYQWRFLGTNLAGQTSDSLVVPNVTANNQGPYLVVVTNSAGSVTSSVAQLYIDSRDCGMPDSWQLTYFGNLNQNASGDFDGDGVSNLQEFLDGTNPTNSTSFRSRLTVLSDGGVVSVSPEQASYALTNNVTLTGTPISPNSFFGWAGDLVTRSNPAALTMNSNKTVRACFLCQPPVAGLVGWWRGEADASDFIGGHTGTFYSGTNVLTPSISSNGVVGSTFVMYGTNYIQVQDAGDLKPAQITVEAWVNPNVQSGSYQTVLAKGSAANDDDAYYLGVINGGVSFWTKNSGGMNQLAGGPVPLNQWTHLAGTFDGSTKRLYVNGILVAVQGGLGPLTYDAPVPLTIGADWVANAPGQLFNGLLDEVSLFSRALSAVEITGLYLANVAGKCTTRPVFTTSPLFADATQGVAYTQSVATVLGALPVTFSLSAGSLPAGLTLSASGLVSGVPTASGSNVFAVLATDAAGLATELVCGLRVLAPLVPAMPAGIVSWWRAENDALDAVGTNHGVLRNGAGFAAGKVGQAFSLDGVSQSIDIPDAPSLRPASLTLETWVLFNSTVGLIHIFAKPLGSGTLDSYGLYLNGGTLVGFIADNGGFGPMLSAGFSPPLGSWHHVAYTFDDLSKQQALYIDGAQVVGGMANKSIGYDSQPLLLGRDTENGNPAFFLPGRIDEAALYNRALSAPEIAAIYNAGTAGKVVVGPYLNMPPLPDALVGQVYTQTVTSVRGSAPVTYDVIGGALPGGLSLNSTGLLSGIPTTPGGFNFTVRATDAAALSNSQPFTLQVYAPVPPPPGIVGWWRGEANALDGIGTNHGVLRNGTGFAGGKVGQAFSLDGVSQSVDIADAPALRPASVTLETWAWFAATGTRILLGKPVGPGTLDSYQIYLSGGTLGAYISDTASGGPAVSIPFSPAIGSWYHVAYTFDDASKQEALYLNGSQVASGFANKTIGYDTQPLLLGRDIENGSPNFFFAGRLDEAAIYNRALGSNEIASLYNAGPGGKTSTGPYFTNPPTLLDGVVNAAYSQTFGAARGSGPVTFSLASGTLPPGLSLTAAGLLSGTPSAAGTFSFTVRATDAAPVSSIQPFTLRVNAQPAPPAGIVAWWRAENNGLDAIGGNNAILINATTFAPGKVGQAFALSGANDALKIPDAPALHPISFTLETWVMFSSANGLQILFAKPLGGGSLDSFAFSLDNATLEGLIADYSGFVPPLSAPFTPVLGQWYHVAFTFDDASKQETIYLNGVAVNTSIASKSIAYDSSPVELGRDIENGSPSYFLAGRMDEAAIYGRALSALEIAALYNAGSAGKAVAGPYITTSPALPAGAVGQPYSQTFASARGTGLVSYSISAGTLPPGLSLSSAGVLIGTPTSAGTFTVTVRATDSATLFGEQICTLNITGQIPPPAGIISWWRGEGDASDVVGANPGVLRNGVAFGTGMSGQAFVLDGIDTSIDVPDSPSLRPASVTLESWVMFNAVGTRVVVGKPVGGGTSDSYQIYLSGGNLGAFVGDAAGSGTGLSIPFSPVLGQWYHVAYTFDDVTRQQVLYLNGLSVASGLGSKAIGYDSQPLELGRDTDNGAPAWFLQGRLDEAAIYSRALSAGEIFSIYNARAAGKTTVGPYFGTFPPLPDAVLSQSYTQTIAAIRGTAPIGYALTAGALPPGLTLTTNGILSGTLSSAGLYSFTVRATDAATLSAEQTFTLQVYAPVPAPPGLSWWWRAENNALDSAGTNQGTLFNTTFATGKVGAAFNLNGTNAYVAISNSAWLNPTGPFSVEFWMKPSIQQFSPDGLWLVVDKSHGFADGTGWVLEGNPDGTFSVAYGKGGSSSPANFISATTPGSVRDDHWHHIAGVFTGTQLAIYLDGAAQAIVTATNLPAGNARDVEIGRSWGGGSPLRSYHGLADEISYYNRALSPGEVASIYNAGPAGKTLSGVSIVLSAALQNGALVLSFGTTVGTTYTIQYNDSLSPGAWQPLAIITAGGTTTRYTNSVAAPQQRFFRVVTLGP